ncbi:MAG: hypothetical protein K6G54_07715 [Oscillospiraceae bacterium]|nr:hypothetical protein [Oscillospiraceae bacterium]
MSETTAPRRWGDRRDATLLRDADSMHFIMGVVYPSRPDNEAYISERIDLTAIKDYLAQKNTEGVDFKYTMFHVILTALLKTITLRPKLNRFYKNENYYQRHAITAGFTMKKSFDDHAEEALAFIHGKPESSIDSIHDEIRDQVTGYRGGKHDATGDAMDLFNRLPRTLSKLIVHFVRWLDKHGWVPQSLIENDANYASVFLTNLGSIRLRCGYHHLSTWGTTSLFVVIGEKKWTPVYNEHGFVRMTETLDLGLTVDERIADGYYYAKSVRLLKFLLEHPALLEQPLSEPVDFEPKKNP